MVMIMSAAVSRCSWWHKHFHWLTTVNRIARRSTKTTACDFFQKVWTTLQCFSWFPYLVSNCAFCKTNSMRYAFNCEYKRLNVCSLKIWCKSYCYLSILNKEKTLTILQKVAWNVTNWIKVIIVQRWNKRIMVTLNWSYLCCTIKIKHCLISTCIGIALFNCSQKWYTCVTMFSLSLLQC